MIAYKPFPADAFAEIVGSRRSARRTPKLIEQFGDDVIALSPQRYREALRLAHLLKTEGYD